MFACVNWVLLFLISLICKKKYWKQGVISVWKNFRFKKIRKKNIYETTPNKGG